MILRHISKYWQVEKMITGEVPEFGIKEGDKVLDVGGGHCAFSRANIIYDFFPEPEHDDEQRAKGPMNIPEGAKFIKGSVEDMSCFGDKEFDFVVCAETLNHVKNPMAACKELIRIGKRGYVEMPSTLYEIIASHAEHLWQCMWEEPERILKFYENHYPKNTITDISKIGRPVIDDAYHRMLRCHDQHATFIDFIWENEFKYEVIT